MEMYRDELENHCLGWYNQNFCSESANSSWQMFSEKSQGLQNFNGWKTQFSKSGKIS